MTTTDLHSLCLWTYSSKAKGNPTTLLWAASSSSDRGVASSTSPLAPLTTTHEGGLTPLRATTSLPKRKRSTTTSNNKNKKKKKNAGKSKKSASSSSLSSGPLSEQDLAHHVSTLYIHGPGGVLHDTERRRLRRQKELQDSHNGNGGHNDSTHDFVQQQQEQLQSLRNLDRHPALLLNADYQPMSWLPLSIWNWQEAVKAVFSGKVTVVDVYPDVTIRAAHLEVPLPSVIALTEYVPHQYDQTPAFTKRNVFLRDEYRCQYCSQLFHTRDLSLDHVVPRCRGGRLHWENAVTCCRKCNGRKGSLDLSELKGRLGMHLLRPPRTPTQYELAATASRMLPRRVHPTWEPYLGKALTAKSRHHETTATSTTPSTVSTTSTTTSTKEQVSKYK